MRQSGHRFLIIVGLLAAACSQQKTDVPILSEPESARTAEPDMAPLQTENPVTVSLIRVEDIQGAWQYRPSGGDDYEVLHVHGDVIDYETIDARQAGWRINSIEEGLLSLDYVRGPGVSALDFPDGERPLYSALRNEAPKLSFMAEDLVFETDNLSLTLSPHPASSLALPEGQIWKLVESYDGLSERHPDEFAQAYISFGNYTASAYAGCNHGGATFVQWDDRFIPGPHIMTQMACNNKGDDVAGWMLQSGPVFEREGDRLWRDFPEGRVLYAAQPSSD